MKCLKINICIIFLSSLVFAQSSQFTEQRDEINKCMAKYFPPAWTMDYEGELVLCDKPSKEMCSITFGIRERNYEGVKCLVEAGYDFNVEDNMYNRRFIPIMTAAFYDDEILKLMFESKIPIEIDVKDDEGHTSLSRITSFRYLFMVNYGRNFSLERMEKSVAFLLEKGADPNVMVDGMTPLMFQASGIRNGKYIPILLKYHANPNLHSPKGETALMMIGDDFEQTKLLLDAGANIYIQDFKGKTVIFHAIENCQANKINALLEKDKNILKSVDNKGRTALEYLKKKSRSKRCKKLGEILTD